MRWRDSRFLEEDTRDKVKDIELKVRKFVENKEV